MEDTKLKLLKGQLNDPRWRLNNLYWITDKSGKRIQFQLNWAQENLLNDLHFCNLILKARQLGFTTLLQIFMLDQCLFNSNIRCGTIAHRLDDARTIFRDKVRYPYDNLPEALRHARPLLSDSAEELVLSNNSNIRVGTSLRSGTLQYLHISEYGKLCAQFADKAREVRTGALNTLQAGQVVFIESTAEGKEGHFFELCEAGQAK
jgi:predicted ABC-type ATPase